MIHMVHETHEVRCNHGLEKSAHTTLHTLHTHCTQQNLSLFALPLTTASIAGRIAKYSLAAAAVGALMRVGYGPNTDDHSIKECGKKHNRVRRR